MPHSIPNSAGLICTSQASERTPARAVGCFNLPARRALTLRIKAPGELRITHGRVWVTYVDAANDASVRAGDHFLQAGEVLHLAGSQQVVMEALDAPSSTPENSSVYFSWEPQAALNLVASHRRVQHAHEVRQPLSDLGTALHQALWAAGRLAQGLAASLACTLMPGRHTP